MEQVLTMVTVEAGADLSTNQYCCMTIASDGQIDPTGDGLRVDGILQNDPAAAGRAASMAIAGISKVKAGAAIARGALVASGANGKCKTAATGNEIFGQALAAASADGDIIPVLLKLSGRAVAP